MLYIEGENHAADFRGLLLGQIYAKEVLVGRWARLVCSHPTLIAW